MLAEITHWDEEKIRLMPYYKALSYIHVYNIRNGIATEWKRAEGGKKTMTLEQFREALKK